MTSEQESSICNIRTLFVKAVIAGIVLLPVTATAAGSSAAGSTNQFVDNYIAGKLEIGTRMVHRVLTDSDSGAKGATQGHGTYLGTIYALEEEQNYLPTKFFLSYFFTEYFGLELAYDSMEAETRATSIYSGAVKSDGTIELSGPTISIIGRYVNSSQFTPYGGIGIGFFSGDFDANASWTLSYPDQETYEALGSPDTSYNGAHNYLEIDDTVALLLTAGVKYDMTPNWYLDCSMQYISADADATHYGYHGDVVYKHDSGTFPMDNFTFRVGVGYSF